MTALNIRWGKEPRGRSPWTRQELIRLDRDENGFAIYEWQDAEIGTDYAAMFDRGSTAWHADHGVSSRIIDADGNTVFIFD